MPVRKVPIAGTEWFHIYPIDGVSIDGVPAREMDVTEDEWLRLNEYQPPAFVCDPLPPDAAQAPQEG